MKTLSFIISICCLQFSAKATNGYDYRDIPVDLRRNADAVVRNQECIIEVSSPAKMEVRMHEVLTILNADGLEKHGQIVLHYDQFVAIKDIRISVQDHSGEVIHSYKRKDLQDKAYLDGYSVANDARYLYLDLSTIPTPFTLDLSYKKVHRGTLDYPEFFPQSTYNLSVEKAHCEIQIPQNQTLNYRCIGCEGPEVQEEKSATHYVWTMRNLKAIPDEPYNLPIRKLAPQVRLSPGQFEIGGYAGSYTSWDGYAGWVQQMLSDLPKLDQSTVSWVQGLTRGQSETEKIRTVYQLLQNSTRYVSIQLGVGGWQPFDPNFVHNKKFGDCKALSWYTKSLLEAVGVKAYYTLIWSGNTALDLDPEFPESAFNHAILTVPVSTGDTIWLECTSQNNPFGYVGMHLAKRRALMLDGGHAQIINMPAIGASSNVQLDSVQLRFLPDGKSTAIDWYRSMSGDAADDLNFVSIYYADSLDQTRWINHFLQDEGAKIESYQLILNTEKDKFPEGQLELHAKADKLVKISSKRMYFQPNFFSDWERKLETDDDRVSPVFRRYGKTWVADLHMKVPEGWVPERLPEPIEEHTEFGSYVRKVSFENAVLHYRCTIVLQAGTFPAGQYNDMAALFNKMAKWDRERAVFVRE